MTVLTVPSAIARLVAHLAACETGPELYNPFREPACAQNALIYLTALAELTGQGAPLPLIVGEAAGPHGCHFTGIAFTSENVLFGSQRPLLLGCLGRDLPFVRCAGREGLPHEVEGSATQVWTAMQAFTVPGLLWNAVPFHPHRADDGMSIRKPRRQEAELGGTFLAELLAIFRPQAVIPVGREAEQLLVRLGVPHVGYVRHPAHGGVPAFSRRMGEIARELQAG